MGAVAVFGKAGATYLYTPDEICALAEGFYLDLSPNDVLRRWTYYGLLGLLAVSGSARE